MQREGSLLTLKYSIKIGNWWWQYVGSFAIMTLFGALMALANTNNMAMIMVFCFLCEAAYGWAQTLS